MDVLPFSAGGVLQRLRQLAQAQTGQPTPPGVWLGSAAELAHLDRRSLSPRRLRELLGHLEQCGALRTWRRPGHRGRYPILLDWHLISDRQGRRFRTDAAATRDWRAPVLHPLPAPQRMACDDSSLDLRSLPDQIWKLYCSERGHLAPPPPLTSERRSQYLRAALAYPGGTAAFLLDFGGALRLARRSRFLLGANRSSRPFGLDWLLRDPANLRKTLEGRYDDLRPLPEAPTDPVQAELPWPEPPAPAPAPAFSEVAASETEWTRLQQDLRRRMNPKTFATWIAPLRAAGYEGRSWSWRLPPPTSCGCPNTSATSSRPAPRRSASSPVSDRECRKCCGRERGAGFPACALPGRESPASNARRPGLRSLALVRAADTLGER